MYILFSRIIVYLYAQISYTLGIIVEFLNFPQNQTFKMATFIASLKAFCLPYFMLPTWNAIRLPSNVYEILRAEIPGNDGKKNRWQCKGIKNTQSY